MCQWFWYTWIGDGLEARWRLEEFVLEVEELPFRLTDIGSYFGFALASPRLQLNSIKTSSRGFETRAGGFVPAECRALLREKLSVFAIRDLFSNKQHTT